MIPANEIVRLVLIFLVIVLCGEVPVHAQGKLGRVRSAVRKSESPKPAKKTERRHDDREERNHHRPSRRRRNRGCNNVGLGLFVDSFVSPPVNEVHVIHHAPPVVAVPAPPQVVEPVYQPVVAPIPASSPVDVFDHVEQSSWTNTWGVRLSAFGGTDFDDITQGSFGLLLQAPNGPGLDASVTMLRESGMSFRDHLYLGDVNFVYEPVVTDSFRLRLGIGVNWLGDAYGGDAGFNMTSGFDWQLSQHWMATGEVDFGTIGDTDMTHAQISLGRLINQNTEWATGYDYRDIGGVTFGTVFTGLRFRF